MNVLTTEKKVGIKTFFTPFKGINGKLRTQPEDFFVTEISNYPPETDSGRFTIAEVTATNWETNILIRELSNRLHVSRQRVGFAGTKDKRAKTTRLMSFFNIPIEKLSELNIKDVEIKNIYYSNSSVKIGNLLGNRFEVIVRNIDKKTDLKNIQKTISFLEEQGGFPNFYGIQRFGVIRPITHIVGKNIVKSDFEKAAMTYIANPIKGEDEKSYNLRTKLQKTKDFSEALKSYPNNLNYEKAILNKLIVEPNDFVSALKELPKNLLTMFIYAYQSYLFNKILSERINKKIPINEAIIGDIILPIRKGIFDQNGIIVKKNNLEKVNKQISKGNAAVSGILFGNDSTYSEDKMGEIEHKVIEKEKIDPRDFIIPEIPYISSAGSRRPLLAIFSNFEYKLIKDELNDNKKALVLNFELQKGSYATSLLREFMKTDDIKNY
jgi:tRNA pseudouridine13 synthase